MFKKYYWSLPNRYSTL